MPVNWCIKADGFALAVGQLATYLQQRKIEKKLLNWHWNPSDSSPK
jgi:hypothetical protein